MIQGKVWGSTEPLIVTPLVEIHRINILPEAFCSIHKHNFKYNAFYCISGAMYIDVRKNDYDLVDTTRLGPGDITTVKPGEYHSFETKIVGAVALEIYYLNPIEASDIVRETCGGVLSDIAKSEKSVILNGSNEGDFINRVI